MRRKKEEKLVLYGEPENLKRGGRAEALAIRQQLSEDNDRSWCDYRSYMAGLIDGEVRGARGEFDRLRPALDLCQQAIHLYGDAQTQSALSGLLQRPR